MNNSLLPRQLALDLTCTPKASLDNFLPGNDRALHGTLQTLVSNWTMPKDASAADNPLNQRCFYWWGPEGSGRSHLLNALTNAAAEAGLEHYALTPAETNSWEDLEQSLATLSSNKMSAIITIDDVDGISEAQVASLFRIFNVVVASQNLHLFIAGNAAPSALQLREDVRTRLGWGLVFQTHLLEDDEKIQALEHAALARGLMLSPDVLPWLLNRFHRDMPNLMALIDALDAYSLETKRAVTLPLVRELLQPK
ncbi:regulatory inactivation of DnaA Hda protein [Polynucleobacter meluiroseus]|uniref:Regulatory inactivation of DnaA Hda protein n=1 Tax=Polynucleobacter meluiroseus TaxID=1938814 RepID=A0A240DXQ6_9BURK|nr:DnaA regulatory inactivator Hda [Polynucleobacter meluiroseus]SNX27978.1 regulatory inactivation of DnaA Hda protein [Polynucleobacter meluiroseus]